MIQELRILGKVLSQFSPTSKYYRRTVTQYNEIVLPSSPLKSISVHLTEHCNLNCAYCDHNCPVAEQGFSDIDQFEYDFIILSKLTNGQVEQIKLLGGEPLLNPDIIHYMQIVRQYIPISFIRIITNGILLTKMGKSFWQACKDNNIAIGISQYPIKIDFDEIYEIATNHSVEVYLEGREQNFFYNLKYDLSGSQDIYQSYEGCDTKNCTFLKDGKLYLCPQIYCSKYLEKYFGVNFSISKDDFLVLDKFNNVNEILDFISHPSPFCRYCVIPKQEVKWKISERKRQEWFL